MYRKSGNNPADGGVDLARFLNLPLYYFDLQDALKHASSVPQSGSEPLKALCEEHLARIAADEIMVMADTGFYLVVQSATGGAADAIAEALNRALLNTFFGSPDLVPDDLDTLFKPVTSIGALPSPANEDRPYSRETIGTEAPRPTRERRQRFSELALRGSLPGEHVELLFEPVHDLLRARATTFFCTPAFCVNGSPIISGYKAFQNISQGDFPLIDRAILAHALKFARRLAQAGVYVTIGAPVSFETLTSSHGRTLYLEALRAAGVPEFQSIVLCLRNLPVGITASRLAELTGCLRPLARHVFVHLPNADPAALNCGYLGAYGFVLTMQSSQTERVASWLTRACEAQTALSCVDRIETSESLEAIRRAGVRFGMGPVFGPMSFRGNAEPIEVDAYMKAAARAAQNEARNVHRLASRRETKETRLRPH